MCGADDCPTCHPESFQGGIYLGDNMQDDYAGEQLTPRSENIPDSEANPDSFDTGFLLDSLIARVAEFQDRVFPNQGVESKMLHLKREADEVIKNPQDRIEWADVLILFIGAAHRQGIIFPDILLAAHQKMDINNERKWGEADADGIHHHLEDGQ